VSDVIADLRKDLERRLEEVDRELVAYEPLLRERAQLQEALETPPFASGTPRTAAPKRKSAPRRSSSSRAPRGANREAILKVVGDRPGVTAAEISDVTKISRAVTYNTLAKLVEQGQLAKTELPGGQTGYRSAKPEGSGSL
jgi:Fic family protein